MTTLSDNLRRALRAESTHDFMALHRMLMAEKAWPASRPAIARLFEIIALLHAKREVNATSLAAICGVSTKSIQRDLDFLRKFLAAPIRYVPDRFCYVLAGEFSFKPQGKGAA